MALLVDGVVHCVHSHESPLVRKINIVGLLSTYLVEFIFFYRLCVLEIGSLGIGDRVLGHGKLYL